MIYSLVLSLVTITTSPKSIYDIVPQWAETESDYQYWRLWARICDQIRDTREANKDTKLRYSVVFEVGNNPQHKLQCESTR